VTTCTRMASKVAALLFVFAVLCQAANGSTTVIYTVNVNTAPLVGHPAGPFSILLAVTDGSGLGDGNNAINVTNVDFGGGNGLGNVALFGGASGSLESGLAITDSSPVNFFSESFSPGQSLRFSVTLTTADDAEGVPDGLSFFILDSSGLPIPALSPAGDFLFAIDMGSNVAPPQTYGTDPSRSPTSGNPISIKAPTVSTDTTPPVTVATSSPSPNSSGWNNTNVTVTLNSTDNELGGTGVKQVTYSATGAQTIGNTIVSGGSAAFAVSAEGVTIVTFFGTDNAGNVEGAKIITVEVDKTPPMVACSASPNVLWPPNNKLVPVNASVTVSDALSGPAGFTLVSVTSNEPDSGLGDIQGFAAGTASTSGQLRAQRLGSGNGRVYTFTYSGSDRAGNTTSCTTTVSVPHDQGQN
jgi:hypothetical protein